MQRYDSKTRGPLQSAKEFGRVNPQDQIKVPQSQYGVRPVNKGTFSSSFYKRPSATTQTYTRLQSSVDSFSKETSVKNMRMSNYMQDSRMHNNSAARQKKSSSSGFHHQQRSASKSKSGSKFFREGRSPATKNPASTGLASRENSMSAVRLAT